MKANENEKSKRLRTLMALLALVVAGLAPAMGGAADPLGLVEPLELWEARYDEVLASADAMAASPDGLLVFVTGRSDGDFFTVAYETATGSEVWQARDDGATGSSFFPSSIAVSPEGSTLFVTGTSPGNGTGNDYATIAYDALTGETLWTARYNNEPWRDPPTNTWEWGAPTSGPEVAASGEKVWATYLADDHLGSDCAAVMSPPIDLTDAGSASFAFEQWRHMGVYESSFGVRHAAGMLFVTTDDGDTFTRIESPNPAYNTTDQIYPAGCFDGLPNGTPGYAGPEGDTPPPPVYSTVGADLDAFLGEDNVRVVIAFGGGFAIPQAGWYIDDFAVTVDDDTTVEDFEGNDGGFVQVTTREVQPAQENVRAITTSPDGDVVFVTGGSSGEGTAYDYATVAYDAATGDELWVARFHNEGDTANAIAVSPDGGTVVVTGYSGNGANYDYATVAYDALTGNERWSAQYEGPGGRHDRGNAIAVSSDSETVFVTGEHDVQTEMCYPEIGCHTIHHSDYATIAYNAGTGDELWIASHDGPPREIQFGPYPSSDIATSLRLSPDGGQVFVTGISGWYLNTDYETVAYDATTGDKLWNASYNGPGDSNDNPAGIGVSADGSRVFVAGDSRSDPSRVSADYATLTYDAVAGDELSISRFDGLGRETAAAMAMDPLGLRLYVTGTSFAPGAGITTVAYVP